MQGRFGRAKVVQVLLGSQASDIVNSYLSRLSTYGILKGASRSMLDVYLDALIEAECIRIVGDEFPKLDLTLLGQAVMRRQQRVLLALPGLTAATSQPGTATTLLRQPTPHAVCDCYGCAVLDTRNRPSACCCRTHASAPATQTDRRPETTCGGRPYI